MAKSRTIFYCTECGNETPKWAGKCPACGAWNTVVEQEAAPKTKSGRSAGTMRGGFHTVKAVSITEVDAQEEIRFSTGMGELDRVLGGGAVKGSLVLVGGAPGVGKSTLLLQICGSLCRSSRVLYVSGEESVRQLKLRSQRLGVASGSLLVLSETGLEDILQAVAAEEPDILIIDSIQTMYNGALDSPPGSIGQVKDCTMSLMQIAKSRDITVFVIGHVNKEGSIAGPKVLEHMVDCVLYFEGEQHSTCRILRAAKNRFGATNEIGVFEMLDTGLAEVENPSQMLLSGRPDGAPGTCVTCVMEKRGGLKVSVCDAYLNIIGGLNLDEPAADLAAVLALASSYLDRPIPADFAAIGEVGLTGELRAVNNLEQRLSEVRRLGFKTCAVPRRRSKPLPSLDGLQVLEAANIVEAIRAALGK